MSKLTQFMNQKGFHPGSIANRKKVWIAQQKEEESKKRAVERKTELEKERSIMKSKKMLGQQGELDFMYKAPPGYEASKSKPTEEQQHAIPAMSIPRYSNDPDDKASFEDRKLINSVQGKATTAKELEERFAYMKGAPKEANYANNIAVNVKPLGIEVRNVRCARCGNWGHTSGDRECAMKDQNPRDDFHKTYEDPLAGMKSSLQSQSLILKSTLQSDHFGKNPNQASTTMLEDEEEEEEDLEAAFLNSLSKKQKKLLLKRLEKEERKQNKRDKKEKKRKRSESSASSSSDSEEDDKHDRKRRKVDESAREGPKEVQHSEDGQRATDRRDQRDEHEDRPRDTAREVSHERRGHGDRVRESDRDREHNGDRDRGTRREASDRPRDSDRGRDNDRYRDREHDSDRNRDREHRSERHVHDDRRRSRSRDRR